MTVITSPKVLFEYLDAWMPVIIPLLQCAELFQETFDNLRVYAKLNSYGFYEINVRGVFTSFAAASNYSVIKDGFLALNNHATENEEIEVSATNLIGLNDLYLN